MTRTRTVIWKEWHEYRWLVWTGLCAFVFTPLVGSLLEYATHAYSVNLGREISSTAASVLLAFGGLFAVLLGVGNTCRDLRPQLLGFWQSRPIGIGRPLATKYLVGLAVLLFVCGIVLTVYAVLFAGGVQPARTTGLCACSSATRSLSSPCTAHRFFSVVSSATPPRPPSCRSGQGC